MNAHERLHAKEFARTESRQIEFESKLPEAAAGEES